MNPKTAYNITRLLLIIALLVGPAACQWMPTSSSSQESQSPRTVSWYMVKALSAQHTSAYVYLHSGQVEEDEEHVRIREKMRVALKAAAAIERFISTDPATLNEDGRKALGHGLASFDDLRSDMPILYREPMEPSVQKMIRGWGV